MSDDDKNFLSGALDSLKANGKDEVKAIVDVLTGPESTEDALCDALAAMAEIAEDIDHAFGLVNANALAPAVQLTRHASPAVQAAALEVVAAAAQNQPTIQRHLDSCGALGACLTLLRAPEEAVVCKAVHAASCLVRDVAPLSHAFVTGGGVASLQAIATAPPSARARARALRLLHGLATAAATRDAVLTAATAAAVTAALGDASPAVWEQAVALLAVLPRTAVGPAQPVAAALRARLARADADDADTAAAAAAVLATLEE